MNRFGYLRDPLFLLGCGLYGLNRFLLKPHFHHAFVHSWFNDGLLIPCALPPLLLLHRWLRLRRHDAPPTFGEISLHLVFWSILFEWWGPHIFKYVTGDWWDVLAYFVGGLLACAWWNRAAILHPAFRPHEL